MSVTQGIDPRNKLVDVSVKESGEAIHPGGKLDSFTNELKCKCVANGVVAFLKGFPGFAEWWFITLDEDRRDNIFVGLQIVILNAFNRVSGTSMEKATAIKDALILWFDQLPSFTQWKEMVLGSTLRDRVDYQLTRYIYDEFKRT
jgi:hypothetical protein